MIEGVTGLEKTTSFGRDSDRKTEILSEVGEICPLKKHSLETC
jgi:hypothetical protein